jgi:hypothetical protein
MVYKVGANIMRVGGGSVGRSPSVFPLSVSSNSRYLQQSNGTPFFLNADTAWCAITQLTTAQMTTYLEDCDARGFNAVIVELIEKAYSDNAPNTIDNIPPFTTPGNFTTQNEAYFARADHFISEAKRLGILVMLWPLYWGQGDGWSGTLPSNVTAWGTWVATRYASYGNIIWYHGGDLIATDLTVYDDLAAGINSVIPTAIHGYHAQRTESAYVAVNGRSWFDPPDGLNNVYTNNTAGVTTPAATEYGRATVRPVIMLESYYEGDGTGTPQSCRRDLWQAICGGLCGHCYGNHDIWTFGGPGFAADFASHYADTGRTQMQHANTLLSQYAWHTLVPKNDNTVISSAKGTDPEKVAPSISADTTFGFIFVPTSQTVTLVKSAFSPSLIRVRLFDPTNASFSTHTASTSNTGTLSVATGGERVIVVDAA